MGSAAGHLSNTTFAKGFPSMARFALMACRSSTERMTSLNSDTSLAVITAAASGGPPPGGEMGAQATRGRLSFRGSVPDQNLKKCRQSRRQAQLARDAVAEPRSTHAHTTTVLCCISKAASSCAIVRDDGALVT